MKKILLLAGATMLVSLGSMAQTPTEQGNFIIDPYIGFPNWQNSTTFNDVEASLLNWGVVSYSEDDVIEFRTVGGPLTYGGRFEYMLADNFGLGLDGNFAKEGFEATVVDSLYSTQSGMYDSLVQYDYVKTKTSIRIMPRFTYHMVQNDRVDVYTAFAAGYKYVKRVKTTTSPNATEDPLLGEDALVPVSFRIAAGARIYFTDNIGAMIEIGAFGGSLMQFGVTAKF